MQNEQSTPRHPLDVLAAPPPGFSDAAAADIARRHWGLEVRVRPLVSERDQNFRLTAADGRRYVLKIANSAEDPQVTDFQVRALLHVEAAAGDALAVPRIVRTPDGATRVTVEADGVAHVARVVSFVEGRPLAGTPVDAGLAREMGAFLARLGAALDGFDHPGASQSLLWDMKQARRLRELTRHIGEAGLRALVEDTLAEFEQATGAFEALRQQVIHNDMNPDNVLVRDGDGLHMAGMIDFGDMVRSPLVVDVAVACAYLRSGGSDLLRPIAAFVGGYHAVRPLADAELDILHTLVKTRLAATVTILQWRAAARGAADPYLQAANQTESGAGPFLARLAAIPQVEAVARYRAARTGGGGRV